MTGNNFLTRHDLDVWKTKNGEKVFCTFLLSFRELQLNEYYRQIKGYNHIKKPIYYLMKMVVVQKHNNLGWSNLFKQKWFDHLKVFKHLMSHFKLKELEHKSALKWPFLNMILQKIPRPNLFRGMVLKILNIGHTW